jgi:ABC-type uncharacterized transport system YnjBCD permease subunit
MSTIERIFAAGSLIPLVLLISVVADVCHGHTRLKDIKERLKEAAWAFLGVLLIVAALVLIVLLPPLGVTGTVLIVGCWVLVILDSHRRETNERLERIAQAAERQPVHEDVELARIASSTEGRTT